jgi:hypothetical protein
MTDYEVSSKKAFSQRNETACIPSARRIAPEVKQEATLQSWPTSPTATDRFAAPDTHQWHPKEYVTSEYERAPVASPIATCGDVAGPLREAALLSVARQMRCPPSSSCRPGRR